MLLKTAVSQNEAGKNRKRSLQCPANQHPKNDKPQPHPPQKINPETPNLLSPGVQGHVIRTPEVGGILPKARRARQRNATARAAAAAGRVPRESAVPPGGSRAGRTPTSGRDHRRSHVTGRTIIREVEKGRRRRKVWNGRRTPTKTPINAARTVETQEGTDREAKSPDATTTETPAARSRGTTRKQCPREEATGRWTGPNGTTGRAAAEATPPTPTQRSGIRVAQGQGHHTGHQGLHGAGPRRGTPGEGGRQTTGPTREAETATRIVTRKCAPCIYYLLKTFVTFCLCVLYSLFV